MMNRNRIANKLSAFYTCAPIPRNGNLSCFNPTAPSVCLNPANVKVGVFSRPFFGNVSVAASTVAKLAVMLTGALFVIPRNPLKRFPTMIAGVLHVRDNPLSLVRGWLALIGWRQAESPLIADSVRPIVFPSHRSVPPVTLLRAKARRFNAIFGDAVFSMARGAFQCWHAGNLPFQTDPSRQHLGSGSIAVACHYFGAHLTATEIDPDYFAAACERIQRETQQIELFPPAPQHPTHEEIPLL